MLQKSYDSMFFPSGTLMLWMLALSLALVSCCVYPTMQIDWNNQTVDSLINSFMRPAWAFGLGWVILPVYTDMGVSEI